MPSSSSSNAFARRVSRVSAFPSRTSAIRSARMVGPRKPPRIMLPIRIRLPPQRQAIFRLSAESRYSYLARETSVHLTEVERALTVLERGGAICRVHVYRNDVPQRRVYPASTLVAPGNLGAPGKLPGGG